MANQIPFSGASNAAGGYLLPDAQGALLTNGLLVESGALQLAGDARTTSSRKEVFPIWLGTPTAGFVAEGAAKPVTGGEFGQASITAKKVASIVLFTDEQIEDVQNGDLNVLVDGGVRRAIADIIDANIIGKDSGTNISTNFDNALRATTNTVELGTAPDALRLAISAAMGKLEANGYGDNMGVLLSGDTRQALRDARAAVETTTAIYDQVDPIYGLDRFFSTNLNTLSEAAGANKIVAFVVARQNLHVRIRKDVTLNVSREATVNDGTTDRHLFQENLTAVRYETRLGFMASDINRAVVAIVNAS
jgi:HK97 family phage major capsid protein